MQGKICVITGASSGIGLAAAGQIAARGPERVILVARDVARGEAARRSVQGAAPPGTSVEVLYADLSLMSAVKSLATAIAQSTPRVDLLVNNAGAAFGNRTVTSEGLERAFALNHMSYFLLTYLLLDQLKAGDAARVVSTTSGAQRFGRIDFDDLQISRKYTEFRGYAASKMANVLFTRELARRLDGSGVTANCFEPGAVATRFAAESGPVSRIMFAIVKTFAKTPDQGAATLVYLADASVAGVTGKLFRNCKEIEPGKAAQDAETARRLWAASAGIAGVSG